MTNNLIVDGWKFEVREGAWVAIDPEDTDLTVGLNEDGSGIHIEDAEYPSWTHTIPFSVIDKLRELARDQ